MNYFRLLIIVVFLVGVGYWNARHFAVGEKVAKTAVAQPTPVFATTTPPWAGITVTRVVDGDTIELETGERVRYIGVDTPETVDPRKAVQCFGREASAFNKQLVEGKSVKLVADVVNKDRYGRLLRYVYLSDGTFVNLKLAQDGYARPLTIPPDVHFSKDFVAAAHEAQEAGRGLWGACYLSS